MSIDKRLLFLLLIGSLSGCADDSHHVSFAHTENNMRISDQVTPVDTGQIFGTPTTAVDKNPLESVGDPMVGPPSRETDPMGADPLTGDVPGTTLDPMGGNDPVSGGGDQDSNSHSRTVKNWYWLRGSVSGGSMQVKINGIFIRQTTGDINFEISDYVNPGNNQLTLIPQSNDPALPVTCKLDIEYSQQHPGSAPVLAYDTTNRLQDTSQQSATPDTASSPITSGGLPNQPDAQSNSQSTSQQTSSKSSDPVSLNFEAE